ncbi:MAG: acetyl-CoA decarbonylase/synthase complex subunit delta [Desulfatiglandaceae bacterium]
MVRVCDLMTADRQQYNKEVTKLAFEIPKQPYSGRIGETVLGTGDASLTLGGEDSYPFHLFEGTMPNPPRIAMEVWDYDPSSEWPAAAVEPFKDVISSTEAWAKKCVEEYGADLIVLQLKSTDPNGMDRSPEESAELAKKVLDAINVPLVLWGTANNQKDEEVLKKISEACEGLNVGLGPVEEANHKGVGASSLGYGHCIVSSSPIDVNLAKQLNVLLGNLGVTQNKIVIDPTSGGLGYGLEYSYSVMERIRMAALTQEDDKLQSPLINNIGNEVWKCKEAGQPVEEVPIMGNPEGRAIGMEVVAAVAYLMSGSDVLILRHPESVRIVRSYIDLMINGGSAKDVQGINRALEMKEIDLGALSPEPELEFSKESAVSPKKEAKEEPKATPEEKPAEEKKAAPAKKAAPEPPKAAPKPQEPAKEEPKKEDKQAIKAEEEKTAAKEAEAEKKAAEEAEAKKKAEEEAKAKAAEEAKVKAEAEAEKKAKAEAEAKAKAEEERKAIAKEEEREALLALRAKRAEERKKQAAAHAASAGAERPKTPAEVQPDLVDKLTDSLARIHRRI